MSTATGEVVDLLQTLIRNRCVNDGRPESGEEARSADAVRSVVDVPGVEVRTFESLPGRQSVLARIEGSDPTAPSLMLLGHLDVVPADASTWRRDPFGGELVDGEVWGRGAVDMLNLTSSMAVAMRRLAESGFQPRGTLAYCAVADEEAGGRHGAGWLVENARDDVLTDYVITESGGVPMDVGAGRRLWVMVAEKGIAWTRLVVRGTSGHASRPLRSDNALLTAMEVVGRLTSFRPAAHIGDLWRRHVAAMGYPEEVAAALTDPARIDEACAALPLGQARFVHANTHTTCAPTVMHGGTKVNVIPDHVTLDVDIRLLPGQTPEAARDELRAMVADLGDRVTLEGLHEDMATESPVDTPLWDALQRVAERAHPGARLVPSLTVGGTDARFFREAGSVAYGFGMFSPRMNMDLFQRMFHGDDERVDVDSLRLSTEMWEALARDLLA